MFIQVFERIDLVWSTLCKNCNWDCNTPFKSDKNTQQINYELLTLVTTIIMVFINTIYLVMLFCGLFSTYQIAPNKIRYKEYSFTFGSLPCKKLTFFKRCRSPINMTEFWLEFDRKFLRWRALSIEHDQKIYLQCYFFTTTNFNVEFDQTMSTTNIKWLVVVIIFIIFWSCSKKIIFVAVEFQSYSFGHLYSVIPLVA